MGNRGFLRVLTLVVMAATGCSASAADPRPVGVGEVRPTRPLSIALRGEPSDLTSNSSGRAAITQRMFNATLVGVDQRGTPYPLLSSVPELSRDSWRVFPDGRMETTYGLKTGLVWHDGTPLAAEDFVFAWRLESSRAELSLPGLPTLEGRSLGEVLSPEPGVLVIRWRQLYADAASPEFTALPRHILQAPLETALEQGRGEPVASHPYWTTEFVGLGPYQLTRWERGAFLEGSAFDSYVRGRPKIDKIVVTWNTDPNVTLARLLAGEVHVTTDAGIDFRQAVALRREWNRTGGGVVILAPVQNRYLGGQQRAAYANPKAVLDVRVRRASIHAIDRSALVDALLEGEGRVAESFAMPGEPFFDTLERVVAKYPYDLRRTEDLMREAGFIKGSDGVYASPDEGRFAPEVLGIAEGIEGQEATVIADYFRQAGIDAQLRLVPSVQMQASDEMKSTYPAWRGNQAMAPERIVTSSISSSENRWSGLNKTGYSDPEHDRFYDLWTRALDRGERNDLALQMYKGMNDGLPGLPLYYNFWITAHTSDVEGPQGRAIYAIQSYGNVHQWQWLR